MSIDALCKTKKIQLEMNTEGIPSQPTADKALLGRAVLNMVNNALDHSPQGGTLYAAVRGKDGFVEISVTDEGTGFSNETLRYAREQFFVDDQSCNSKLHFGMGLYITSSMIEQHHGELILGNFESTGGAKVILKIPF